MSTPPPPPTIQGRMFSEEGAEHRSGGGGCLLVWKALPNSPFRSGHFECTQVRGVPSPSAIHHKWMWVSGWVGGWMGGGGLCPGPQRPKIFSGRRWGLSWSLLIVHRRYGGGGPARPPPPPASCWHPKHRRIAVALACTNIGSADGPEENWPGHRGRGRGRGGWYYIIGFAFFPL